MTLYAGTVQTNTFPVFYKKLFSNREVQVAELLIQGYSNQEICDALNIKMQTVKYHLTNIYRKADSKGRTHLTYQILRATNNQVHSPVS